MGAIKVLYYYYYCCCCCYDIIITLRLGLVLTSEKKNGYRQRDRNILREVRGINLPVPGILQRCLWPHPYIYVQKKKQKPIKPI